MRGTPVVGELLDAALSMQNLGLAWEEVAENRGMAGADGTSIRRWSRNWEERLIALARQVRANRYHPGPVRTLRIPKAQPGEWRTLAVPTVTDRVLQRAIYQVLSPRLEREFLSCSYGYRPRRGIRQAVQAILDLRERGYRHVLDADIDGFFENVDRALLMGLLHERVADEAVLALIAHILEHQRTPQPGKGIPMGSPLSPLLANLYLHPFDRAIVLGRWQLVRYADDFVVLSRTPLEARQSYGAAEAALRALRLHYHAKKTRLTSFDDGWRFLGVWFERDSYAYLWKHKRITVQGPQVDVLFGEYGPDYGGE